MNSGNYRNRKLLDTLREAPECMHCGKHNDGTVVAAHSNQLRDGKGKGLKAHDFRVAALCYDCHMSMDQGKGLSKDARKEMFDEAHRKTIGWLFESGRLRI